MNDKKCVICDKKLIAAPLYCSDECKNKHAEVKKANKRTKIRQPIINTFNRVGIDYKSLQDLTEKVEVSNWITRETVETTPLIKECVEWVYRTQLKYEQGDMGCRLDDFDRVRYWVLAEDRNVYMSCLD